MFRKSRYFINQFHTIKRKFHQEAAVIGTAQNTNSAEYQVSDSFYQGSVSDEIRSAAFHCWENPLR